MLVFYKIERVSANPLSEISFIAGRQRSGATVISDRGFTDTPPVLVKYTC